MVKMSIIIPAYNVESYIEKALESCVNQTLKDIEIIVVNDGATDKTPSIVKRYAEIHRNIITVNTGNQGLSMARNEGMKSATGKYIFFLDADDWVEYDCMERCYEELERNNLDVVMFDYVEEYNSESAFLEKRIEKVQQVMEPDSLYTGEELALLQYRNKCIYPTVWKNAYRREFLESNDVHFQKGVYFEDNPFFYDWIRWCNRCKYIPYVLYHYRIREGSIMKSDFGIDKINSIFAISNRILDNLMKDENFQRVWECLAVTIILDSLFGGTLSKMSVEDKEKLEAYKQFIINEKEKLLVKIRRIYFDIDKSIDTLRNVCLLSEKITLVFGYYTSEMEEELENIMEINRDYTRKVLSGFPLQEAGKSIGIYGCGSISDYILEIYRKLIGDIRAEITFIDTNIESYSCHHKGYHVVNVKDLEKTRIQEIVILSFLYEQEMYDTVKKVYGNKYIIHRLFYNDLVSVEGTCYRD